MAATPLVWSLKVKDLEGLIFQVFDNKVVSLKLFMNQRVNWECLTDGLTKA
jgi:hypothetical protein